MSCIYIKRGRGTHTVEEEDIWEAEQDYKRIWYLEHGVKGSTPKKKTKIDEDIRLT